MNDGLPERTIDNARLFKSISDYAAVIYDQALVLQTTLLNMGELCLIMKDLQEPLKHAFAYSSKKVSVDIELQRLLQKLFVALQNVKSFVIERAQTQFSDDLLKIEKECVPYIKRLEETITALVVHMRRIGVYNKKSQQDHLSPWVYRRPAHETMTRSLWPMIFLPDRNLVHIPRREMLKKISDIIAPLAKPQHVCIVNKNGAGAMGRSETILETAYQSLEKGVFGVIVWIPCHSEASLSSSFHYLAERILQNDPSFAYSPAESITTGTKGSSKLSTLLTKSSVINLVVKWMEMLPMPYLLIFDNADDPSFLPPSMFPRAGQGTVVLLTLALHISTWRNVLHSRPKVVELSHLDAEEGIEMAEQSLSSVVTVPKIDAIDLMKYFDYSPVHFCCAINVINCMRNRSFVEIGPRDYLDRIARDVPTLLGHLVRETSSGDKVPNALIMSSDSALKQVITAYKSVMIRLHCAADFAHASKRTLQHIMDLVCFVCSDGIDLRMIHDWVKPSYSPLLFAADSKAFATSAPAAAASPTGWSGPLQSARCTAMKMDIAFNKSLLGERSVLSSEDTEFIVSVSSLYPRRLKTSGELSYEWVVYRRHADLEYFFNTVKVKLSAKLSQMPFPSLQPNGLLKQQTNKLNELFTELCSDPKWALLCDDELVKKFFNIHPTDCSESQITERMMGLMQPLVALGLLRVQHRLSVYKVGNGDAVPSDEDGNLSSYGRKTLVTLGTHSTVQDAVLYGLRREGRDQNVAKEVVRFLIAYFRHLEVSECSSAEISWIDEGISREALLPHVERAVTMTSSDLSVCLELCFAAYTFAVERQVFKTAYVLATRALDILITLAPSDLPISAEISFWRFNIAHCSLKRRSYAEATLRYTEALESYHVTSTHPDSDPRIATIYSELAEAYQLQGNYTAAEIHLNNMLAVWQRCVETERDNDSYKAEVVTYNIKMSVVKNLQADMSSALIYSQKAIEAISTSFSKGCRDVEVADAMRSHALLLMKAEKFDDAKNTLRDALQLYERVERSLLHKNVPVLYMSLAQCYLAQAKFSSAEEVLYHAVDIIDKLRSDSAILEMKAEVLAMLSEVLMEQGKYDDSVKSAKESYNILKRLHGDNNEKTALALCSTGKLLKTLARYVDAEVVFNEVLTISDKCLRSQATIEALNQLAEMASAQSKYLEAESYVSRALTCLREAQYDGKDRESTAVIANQLCALAELKKEQHEYEKARECYEEALDMLRRVYGSQHALVAHVLELLADLFSDRGEERTARIHRDESIRIYRQIGQEGSAVLDASPQEEEGAEDNVSKTTLAADSNVTVSAGALGSLAALLSADDKFDEAAPMLEKAVLLLTNQYGKNHPRIAMALNNLAKVLRMKGRLSQAQAMYERALFILRKVHGDNHPHVATAMHNLGTLLALQGKNTEAISIMLTALDIRKKVFGNDHVQVAESLKALGHLNYLENCFTQAREYVEGCLLIRRKVSEQSGDKSSVAISLNNKALVLKSMLMYSEAEECARESLLIRREIHEVVNPSHPSIGTGCNTLGTLLIAMGRQQEAREYLDKALRIRRDNYGNVHISVANTLNSLAELSFGDGRYGEAANLMQQVVDIRSAIYGESSGVVVANLTRLMSIYRITGNETDAARVEAQLCLVSNGTESAADNAATLAMVMDAFEEDEDGATHVLKMDTTSGVVVGGGKVVRVDTNLSNVVQGGPGWPDRLIAKLALDQEALKAEIRDEEKNIVDTKNSVDEYLRKTAEIKDMIEAKTIKLKDLESLVATDKRYRYDLDQNLTERGLLIEQLKQLESSEERESENVLKAHEDNLSKIDAKLKILSIEIALVEDVRNRFKDSEKSVTVIDEKIQTKNRVIEQIRWQLVQSDGNDEAFITTLHANLRNEINEKASIEIERELAEVVHRKILNELEAVRIRHGIASDISIFAKARAAQESRSARNKMLLDDLSDDSSEDDDADDDEDGAGEGEDAEKMASLKKRVKKQRILINILTSQVESLGVVPIAEVVTFVKAEQRLQNALVRLMEGDEEAAKDFDKWDQFVRNHPEFKAKEELKKLKWTRENTPINAAALRHIKGLVPPSIIVSYTLQMLEEVLPAAIAKRVWSKKALWLTRISPSRISRLHIADLQTKYSTQGLDEIELRAVFAALPVTFENDGKGDKAAWRDSVLQSLQGKCKQDLPWSAEIEHSPDFVPLAEDVAAVIAKTARNPCYKMLPDPLPFDPDAECMELVEVSHKDEGEMSAQDVIASAAAGSQDTGRALGAGKEEVGVSGPPTRSIMRRASIFGSQVERSSSSGKIVIDSEAKPSPRPPALGGMGGMLAEMQLKAQKKKASDP